MPTLKPRRRPKIVRLPASSAEVTADQVVSATSSAATAAGAVPAEAVSSLDASGRGDSSGQRHKKRQRRPTEGFVERGEIPVRLAMKRSRKISDCPTREMRNEMKETIRTREPMTTEEDATEKDAHAEKKRKKRQRNKSYWEKHGPRINSRRRQEHQEKNRSKKAREEEILDESEIIVQRQRKKKQFNKSNWEKHGPRYNAKRRRERRENKMREEERLEALEIVMQRQERQRAKESEVAQRTAEMRARKADQLQLEWEARSHSERAELQEVKPGKQTT